jgi:hypothetical protein
MASVVIFTDVQGWDKNLEPSVFGGSQVIWDDYEPKTPRLVCRECGHEFNEPFVMTDEELEDARKPRAVEELIECPRPKVIMLDSAADLLGLPTDEER